MAITKEKKEQIVSDIQNKLQKSIIAVLTDYRGLSVSDISELRKELREKGIDYKVAKNTLYLKSLKNLGVEIDKSVFQQPIAMAFGYEDEVDPPKILNDFSKKHENLEIIGGIADGKYIPREYIINLASLPSKEELYARIVGSIASPLRGFISVLQGNLRGLVSVLNQYKDKL